MQTTQCRQAFDENNNAIVVDKMSIDLDGSSAVVVGDLVWLKHDAVHFLTTPFIVEHLNGETKTSDTNSHFRQTVQ